MITVHTEIFSSKETADELIKKYTFLKKYNFNFFNELAKIDKKGKGINEECHSKILAWLLSAKINKKNSQYFFFRNFIRNLNGLKIENSLLDNFVHDLSKDVIVETEFNNIDIFIYSKAMDFVCVIENKIDSGLGKDQLKRYMDFIDNSIYGKCKHKHFVYLRRYLDTKCSNDNKQIQSSGFQEMEYSDISKMIDETVLSKAENERMYFNILQYKEYLDLYWYDTIDGVWIENVKKCQQGVL